MSTRLSFAENGSVFPYHRSAFTSESNHLWCSCTASFLTSSAKPASKGLPQVCSVGNAKPDNASYCGYRFFKLVWHLRREVVAEQNKSACILNGSLEGSVDPIDANRGVSSGILLEKHIHIFVPRLFFILGDTRPCTSEDYGWNTKTFSYWLLVVYTFNHIVFYN